MTLCSKEAEHIWRPGISVDGVYPHCVVQGSWETVTTSILRSSCKYVHLAGQLEGPSGAEEILLHEHLENSLSVSHFLPLSLSLSLSL
jgi:hypothetical protein